MTSEEKQLLLKDLCARLPYEVKVEYRGEPITLDYALFAKEYSLAFGQYPMKFNLDKLDTIKPYLRPMSSMTVEEQKEWFEQGNVDYDCEFKPEPTVAVEFSHLSVDWLNAHHFDYRGLIEKGLAIEVTEENNPYKK